MKDKDCIEWEIIVVETLCSTKRVKVCMQNCL